MIKLRPNVIILLSREGWDSIAMSRSTKAFQVMCYADNFNRALLVLQIIL